MGSQSQERASKQKRALVQRLSPSIKYLNPMAQTSLALLLPFSVGYMTMGIKPLDVGTRSRYKALSRFEGINANICDSVLGARS